MNSDTTPFVYGDYFYTLFDQGFMTAPDARIGEQVPLHLTRSQDGRSSDTRRSIKKDSAGHMNHSEIATLRT